MNAILYIPDVSKPVDFLIFITDSNTVSLAEFA